jgi:hypothetical protein
MIATREELSVHSQLDPSGAQFLLMLPTIRGTAAAASRTVPPVERQEFVAEVVANCFVAFVRLVKRGKTSCAFAAILARFACGQVRAGRRVGSRIRTGDVLSTLAQRGRRFFVIRLDESVGEAGSSRVMAISDRRTNPALLAASRLDFFGLARTPAHASARD